VARWLVVIPFYFFSAILTFLLLTVASRVLRLRVGANGLAITAVIVAVALVALPLALGWVDLEHLGGRRLLALGIATFVVAALDTLLQPRLPLPADRDLADF
jgi:uncharacterized membrane protein YadS